KLDGPRQKRDNSSPKALQDKLRCMDLGIVGLAQSGKTTLFDALTRGHAHTSGFGSLERSIGVVKVPDERLDKMSALIKAKKVTHLEVRFLDFPGSLSLRGEATSA